MKARFVVDWDDTLVEDQWPDQGPWLPGAVDALHALSRLGDVVIFSCRVSPYAFPSRRHWHEDVFRPVEEVDNEVARMKAMLEGIGLPSIEIWERPYKPAATVYIDNRGVRFDGDWDSTLEAVLDAIAPMEVKTADPQIQDFFDELDAATRRHPSSQAFVNRVKSWIDLHDRKQKDYGSDADPFANVREGAKELGLPGWVGCVIRMNDKMRRLNKAARQYIETGEISLANEGIEDSFDDMAVYAGIAGVLFGEES